MNDAAVDVLTGLVALVVAGLLVRRVIVALKEGVVPIYKTRTTRAEAGEGKFMAIVALNALGALAMLAIGLDLMMGLGLKAMLTGG